MVVGLLIFSLASSKLPSYTVTLAPWAALGLGRLIARHAAAAPKPFLLTAAGAALAMAVGVIILPMRLESRIGANSSTRDVCRFLQAHHARRVDSDRYWAGMEFYLGEDTIHYVARVTDAPVPNLTAEIKARQIRKAHRRERDSDPGLPPDRFINPALWPLLPPGAAAGADAAAGSWWLVHFRRQKESPFNAVIPRGPAQTVRIGDFILYQMPVPP